MAQDVELVEQDAGLRGVPRGHDAKGFPHVHHGEPEPGGFPRAGPGVELLQTRLGAIGPTEPDWPVPDEIADDDAIDVPLLDRHFVEPDDPGAGRPPAPQLLAHVLLLQRLDGVPVEAQLLGHVSDGRGATAPAHVEGEALRVEGVVGQEGEPFLLHRATGSAGHPPDFDLEGDAQVPTGQIADAAPLAVVPATLPAPARPAGRFFGRRSSTTTLAYRSPNTPVTVVLGRKPGKRYESRR